jgi:hypothetical protein
MGDDDDGSDDPSCVATSRVAEPTEGVADIIWAVDTSSSMSDERDEVQGALNYFSSFIEEAGIDHRVILLAEDMTVPPPLGGSPRFLHVPKGIGSTSSLEKIIQYYPDYQAFLRPGGVVNIVVVTDDNSGMSYAEFETARAALTNPGIASNYQFHAICSEPNPDIPFLGCFGGLGAGGADAAGTVYLEMVADRDGVWRSICESDWGPIFDALAEAAATSAYLPCVYELPEPPGDQELDPDRVNFVFTPSSGTPLTVPRVESSAACGANEGWYYDDPENPGLIFACPETCSQLENEANGRVDIAFGCATVVE